MTGRRVLGFGSAGLLLVDAPVSLVALAASLRWGVHDTFVVVFEWRQSHPASYAVSVIVLLLVALRRRSA